MDWNVFIEKVGNGYILHASDGETISSRVFEESEETHKGELDAFVKMVWELADFFAVYNNKHERYRLRMEVEDSNKMEKEDL